jgi:hypothetical protein
VVVEYVYFTTTRRAMAAAPRSPTRARWPCTLQHTFVAMPDDGYEPRGDDFRVGYFGQQRHQSDRHQRDAV